MRQLILDTETTGLDHKLGHRIIEFAALEMINRRLTGNFLHLYINPERLIDEGAMRIHGIKDEDVTDKPVFRELVHQIVDFISGAELIIHNAKFDIGFLDHHLLQENLAATSSVVTKVIDTLLIARQKFPGSKNTLDALCDRFNVDRSNRDYHGALIDCRLLADVYLNLTQEQINLMDFDETNKFVNNYKFEKVKSQDFKVVKPLHDEILEHQRYLEHLNELSKGDSPWYNSLKH